MVANFPLILEHLFHIQSKISSWDLEPSWNYAYFEVPKRKSSKQKTCLDYAKMGCESYGWAHGSFIQDTIGARGRPKQLPT